MQAPFHSALQTVKPEWIDYNGHLNMAYYNVLFDEAMDQIYPDIGFGTDYLERTGCTTYAAEFHICYMRELHAGDEVSCSFYVIDHDEKRFHTYQEMHHKDGWLAATAEGMMLHVDQSGPRVAPMPQHIQDWMAAYQAAQTEMPDPSRIRRQIGLRR